MMGVSLLSWWAPWTTPGSLCQRADSRGPSYSALMRWLGMQAARARKTSDVIRELGFEPHPISTTSGGRWGLEVEFNHAGDDSINSALVIKPQ